MPTDGRLDMKAKYENRTVDFYYRNDRGGTAGLGCSPHLHYHIEILYMISGRTHAYLDSEHYTVESGDLLIVFPNKIHRFVDEKRGNKYMLFIINPNLVPEFEGLLATSVPDTPLIKNAFANQRLEAVTRILADLRSFPDEQKDALIKGYLLSFFGEFISMLRVSSVRNDDNQAMKAVVLYCSQNFTRDLSLSFLERELHLSKYYISHLFGDKLNIRFNDYINSLRISESCRLLRTTDDSITEIADASGFGTLRTFNRAFIKQMGVSPSDYRKNNKGRFTNVSMPPEKAGENGYVTPLAQRHESESERELVRLINYTLELGGQSKSPKEAEVSDIPVQYNLADADTSAYSAYTDCCEDICSQYSDGCDYNDGCNYDDGCDYNGCN